MNVDKQLFDDKRVRSALSLAIGCYDMANTLGPLTGLETAGACATLGQLIYLRSHVVSNWILKPCRCSYPSTWGRVACKKGTEAMLGIIMFSAM
jgi:ABC-type transport system substrate-binding protein